jgi:sugar phosphate isomerase/epimerase
MYSGEMNCGNTRSSVPALSRRSMLALAAAAPLMAKKQHIPVGLELYSVRNELSKDLMGTVRAVAKMGYEDVEFYAPYTQWTPAYAKEVRKLLDDVNIRCLSTHNGSPSFSGAGLDHAIELNQIIGSKIIVMASPGKVTTLDSWKQVAETLDHAAEKLRPIGLRAGYHNHLAEFQPLDGKRPIEVIAANTAKDVVLQFDVGPCLEAGSDPVAWIDANPGRIRSMHVKDWAPGKGYQVLLGDGIGKWKKMFKAAEKTGGVEYYLIEQEGSALPPLETAQHCLDNFRKLHS